MTRTLRTLDSLLSRIESIMMVVFTFIGLAIGALQVVLRYLFNTGVHWSMPVFVLFTVFGMLMAGSRAVREDAHVRVDIVPLLAPPHAKKILKLIEHIFAIALCGYFFYAGIQYVEFQKMMGATSPGTGLPQWIIWLIVPITMGFFCIRYGIRIVLAWRNEDTPVEHGATVDLDADIAQAIDRDGGSAMTTPHESNRGDEP